MSAVTVSSARSVLTLGPRANIHCGLPGIKGNEVIFTIIRALILLGLFIWLGI